MSDGSRLLACKHYFDQKTEQCTSYSLLLIDETIPNPGDTIRRSEYIASKIFQSSSIRCFWRSPPTQSYSHKWSGVNSVVCSKSDWVCKHLNCIMTTHNKQQLAACLKRAKLTALQSIFQVAIGIRIINAWKIVLVPVEVLYSLLVYDRMLM